MKSGDRRSPAAVRSVVVLIAAVCALLGSAGFAVSQPVGATGFAQASVGDNPYAQSDDEAAPVGVRGVAAPQYRIRERGRAVLLWVAVAAVAALVLVGRFRRPAAVGGAGRQRLIWLCIARC